MSDAKNLATVYDPKHVEPEIRALWERGNYFHADPDNPHEPRDAYTIVIPPPNVTGALHGGHALNNTLQDILIRWRRMQGFNTLWMPGVDHAGIATQAVVERTIFETEKKTRHDLGREELVRRIWEWKEKYGNRIIEQLKLMGCSCDWERTRFTLDEMCARAVRHTFFKLFKDGLIVRGKRLVNWDTQLQTAVADDEVYHETVKGHFYHFKYPVIDPKPGEPEFVHIATTRPETMLGDTAVAVHPDPDTRLKQMEATLRASLGPATDKERAGIEALLEEIAERRRTVLPTLLKLRDMAHEKRQVRLPLVCRPIPLICDEWADPMLGSGCVKITPAHDANDYEVRQRHPYLAMINVMMPDGRIASLESHSKNLETKQLEGLKFATEGRKAVVAAMEARELVEKIEDRDIDVGHSDRSKTPIEPFLSDQWFVRMGDVENASSIEGLRGSSGLAQLAMDAVCQQEHASHDERRTCGKVHFFPSRYAKTFLDWLGEKRDWCISRQLWWGHRIPVWRYQLSTQGMVGALTSNPSVMPARDRAAFVIYEKLQESFPQIVSGFSLRESAYQGGLPIPGPQMGADGTMIPPIVPSEVEPALYLCVAENADLIAPELEQLGYIQDPDVLDTWFSSALWPHSTLGWPEDTPELRRYYPGSVLSTAREIITLWVARMVLTGRYNLGKVPFHDVYVHAVVQDEQGRPFKKTLGNGYDPVDIIEVYGADALRFTMASLATETQDIRLPTKRVKLPDGRELQTSERFELGRNFSNKIWNAARFAFMTLPGDSVGPASVDPASVGPASVGPACRAGPPRSASGVYDLVPRPAGGAYLELSTLPIEDRWILSQVSRAAVEVQDALGRFQFSRAAGAARDFFWDSLCDWYLELVKLRVREDRQVAEARQVLAFALDQALRLLHPFMPFITEHLWSHLNGVAPQRGLPGILAVESASAALIVAPYPPAEGWPALNDAQADAVFADLRTATRAVRDIRQTQNVPPKQTVNVTIKVPPERVTSMKREAHVIEELANVGELIVDPNATAPRNAATLVIGDMQIFVHDVIDPAAERQRLQKELANLDKQIAGLQGKLNNAGFVQNAPPEVVATERSRLGDLQTKRDQLVQTMNALLE